MRVARSLFTPTAGMLRYCQVSLALHCCLLLLLLTIGRKEKGGGTQIISIKSTYNEIAAFHTLILPLHHAADALALQ